MAGKRRLRRHEEESRPVVINDFIYDDPRPSDSVPEDESVFSDTPEEAIRKLRGRQPGETSDPASDSTEDAPVSVDSEKDTRPKVYSGGIILDDNLQPVSDPDSKPRKRHPVIRGLILTLITLILLLTVAAFVFHRRGWKQILSSIRQRTRKSFFAAAEIGKIGERKRPLFSAARRPKYGMKMQGKSRKRD